MPKAIIAFLLFAAVCATGLQTTKPLFSTEMLPAAQSNYIATEQDIAQADTALALLRGQYKDIRGSTYSNGYITDPSPPAAPHTAATINKLAHHMKQLRKSLMKQPEVPEGSSPEEMMLFQKLLGGLKRSTPRKYDAEPAMHEANQIELDAVQRLADQINMVSNALESPEENELHRQTHAQSRMLHRMTHVLEAMNDEMASEKQRHYEDMLEVLMHQHLADPDYNDSLHDHLLAHHLAREHRDNEFVDHVTHHMLYNGLGRRANPQGNYENSFGDVLGQQMSKRNNELALKNQREINSYVEAEEQRNKEATELFKNALAAHTKQTTQPQQPAQTEEPKQEQPQAPEPIVPQH